MKSRGRYAAFFILAAVFLSFTFYRLSRYPASNKETRGEAAVAAAPSAAAPAPSATLPPAKRPRRAPPSETVVQTPVDINTATKEELMTLPGIGPVTAERIVEKRLELGGFGSVEELTEVKWIGKVKLERLRGLVTVRPGPSKAQAPSVAPKSVERQTD